MKGRILKGIIVSTKLNKTAVVEVELFKSHDRYDRRYKTNKKYKVHNENLELKEGDAVTIIESRPISKTKTWVIKLEDNK